MVLFLKVSTISTCTAHSSFPSSGHGEAEMRQPPEALKQTEYYGKPDATAAFYRPSGAFAAVEEKDH